VVLTHWGILLRIVEIELSTNFRDLSPIRGAYSSCLENHFGRSWPTVDGQFATQVRSPSGSL